MSERADVTEQDGFFVGEAKELRFYVTTGPDIVVAARAANGATSISVEPLRRALASGDQVRFRSKGDEAGIVATLSAAAVLGAETLAVNAISGELHANTIGRLIQNVTGYTMEWVLRRGIRGASLLTKTPSIVDAALGIVKVALDRADTVSGAGAILIEPGRYQHTLRKTNTADESVLADGELALLLGATR